MSSGYVQTYDENFDIDAYHESLATDILNIAESSVLHIWSAGNMDHMRLPANVDIHSFLSRTIRTLLYRWFLIIGTNRGLQQAGQTEAEMATYRNYLSAMSFREYMIYIVLLPGLSPDLNLPGLREKFGRIYSTTMEETLALVEQAEDSYDSSTFEQRDAWKNEHYKAFIAYRDANGFSAEIVLYTPSYPDIIFTTGSDGSGATQDSPQIKIPPVVTYKIRKSSPASTDKIPFGMSKDYKFNDAGEFFDSNNENVYRLQFRRWESLVEFSTIWRSGAQAEALCVVFDQFMVQNERYFLKAGINQVLPWGRTGEPDVRLDNAGVHYRKTLWYFRSHEFRLYGPVTRISGVDADVLPSSGQKII